MTQEIQNQEVLTQWPYQWELVNEDQTKRITLIAQDNLISHNQYPQDVHKKIQNAKVLVVDASKRLNGDFSKKNLFQLSMASPFFKAFLNNDHDLFISLMENNVPEAFKDADKDTIAKLFHILNQTFDWQKELTKEQRAQVSTLFKNLGIETPLENISFLSFLSIENSIKDVFKNPNLENSLLSKAAKEQNALFLNKDQLAQFFSISEKHSSGATSESNHNPKIQFSSMDRDLEELSELISESNQTLDTFIEKASLILQQYFETKNMESNPNDIAEFFKAYLDVIQGALIKEISQDTEKVQHLAVLFAKISLRPFVQPSIQNLIDYSQNENVINPSLSRYFQQAQKTDKISAIQFMHENPKAKANKLKAEVTHQIKENDQVTVVASIPNATALLSELHNQGFKEIKA